MSPRPTADAWLALPKEERDASLVWLRKKARRWEADHLRAEGIAVVRAMADALESLEPADEELASP